MLVALIYHNGKNQPWSIHYTRPFDHPDIYEWEPLVERNPLYKIVICDDNGDWKNVKQCFGKNNCWNNVRAKCNFAKDCKLRQVQAFYNRQKAIEEGKIIRHWTYSGWLYQVKGYKHDEDVPEEQDAELHKEYELWLKAHGF